MTHRSIDRRTSTGRTAALRFTLLAAAVFSTSSALAQANNFDLIISGKKVGKDSYTLKPSKKGFSLSSRFTIHIPGGDTGLASVADYTDDFSLAPDYTYLEGTTADHGNYAHHYAYTPNKQFSELTVASYSDEKPITSAFPIKPGFLLLTPMDAGTGQTVLLSILTHPAPDDMYEVFVADPLSGGGGGGGGRGGKRGGGGGSADTGSDATSAAGEPSNNVYDAKWFKGKDSGGTLEGKPVLLHTYMLAYGKSRYIFYADQTNTLMVLSAPALKANYVRANFQLNAPSSAAPAGAAEPRP